MFAEFTDHEVRRIEIGRHRDNKLLGMDEDRRSQLFLNVHITPTSTNSFVEKYPPLRKVSWDPRIAIEATISLSKMLTSFVRRSAIGIARHGVSATTRTCSSRRFASASGSFLPSIASLSEDFTRFLLENLFQRKLPFKVMYSDAISLGKTDAEPAENTVASSVLQKLKGVKLDGRSIYLDMQATTPVDPRVLDAMLPFYTEQFGNPHSRTHPYGWENEMAVEKAREVRPKALLVLFLSVGVVFLGTWRTPLGLAPWTRSLQIG